MRALVAVDGTEHDNVVLEKVVPWLKAAASRVDLLTVVGDSDIHATTASEPSTIITPQGERSTALRIEEPGPRAVEDRTQAIERAKAEAYDRLRDLAAKYLAGLEYDAHVVGAESSAAHAAADAILAKAGEHQVDAIAIGTHGRGAVTRVVMGSVAEEVVRRSLLPVFIVRVIS